MLPAKKAPLSIVSEGWKRLGTPNQRLLQKRIQSEWKYLGQSQWYVKERNRWKSQELQGSSYLCFSILCRDSTEELVWRHQFRLSTRESLPYVLPLPHFLTNTNTNTPRIHPIQHQHPSNTPSSYTIGNRVLFLPTHHHPPSSISYHTGN